MDGCGEALQRLFFRVRLRSVVLILKGAVVQGGYGSGSGSYGVSRGVVTYGFSLEGRVGLVLLRRTVGGLIYHAILVRRRSQVIRRVNGYGFLFPWFEVVISNGRGVVRVLSLRENKGVIRHYIQVVSGGRVRRSILWGLYASWEDLISGFGVCV